jgi:hypothetical protein
MDMKAEMYSLLSGALAQICANTVTRLTSDGWSLDTEGVVFRRPDLHLSTWQFQAEIQETTKRNKFSGFEIVVETIVVGWSNKKGVHHESFRVPVPFSEPSEWENLFSSLEEKIYGGVLVHFLKGL